MEPNGSYTSEDYISYVSPLHEVLKGTTAMPTLEQFQKLNNSISNPSMNSMSIIPESEEVAMFPSTENSTFSYNMDVELPPSILSSNSILVAPADGASSFSTSFTVPSMIQGIPLAQSEDYISYVSPLHEAFRGTTAMPTLEQFQKLNTSMPISTPFMNSMSITPAPEAQTMFPASTLLYMDSTSLVANFTVAPPIQGNPLPVMDASLNSSGVFNPSPVSQYPGWPLYGEQKPNTILRPSPHGNVQPVNTAHIYPVPESSEARLGKQPMMMGSPNVIFHNNVAPYTSSTVPEQRPREYTCKRCNLTFYTSQAYGGHMSSHSKTKKKFQLG